MKKILYILIITLFSVNISFAQEKDSTNEIYITDLMPKFPGGEIALFEFISENIIYPAEAEKANITGFIYISFVVEKDGSITNVKQAEGSIDIGGGCIKEAIRIVKSMPKWSPGFQRGKAVRVSYVLPIEFTLSEKAQK